jgi:hypothetical protein
MARLGLWGYLSKREEARREFRVKCWLMSGITCKSDESRLRISDHPGQNEDRAPRTHPVQGSGQCSGLPLLQTYIHDRYKPGTIKHLYSW